MYLGFFNFFNNRFYICSSKNKTLFRPVFKLLATLFTCFQKILSSIFSFQGKIIRSRWMFNIKFIICLIIESFNYFVHYFIFSFIFVVSNISVLFNIFFGLKFSWLVHDSFLCLFHCSFFAFFVSGPFN